MTRTPPLKKQKRNVSRSISSTSADSNQELLILGEPRMSDIAPDLHIPFHLPMPLKSETDSRDGSLKKGDRDCMYGSLAKADEETLMSDDDEEVFLEEDSARYYNFGGTAMGGQAGPLVPPGRRRHSIGTFMGRERTISVASSTRSFKDDFPSTCTAAAAAAAMSSSRDMTDTCQASGRLSGSNSSVIIDEHTLRHGSYPRKRCTKCVVSRTNKKSTNMDDILIISVRESSGSSLWVEYFTSYFDKISRQANRKPIKVHHLGLEDVIQARGDVRFIAERTASVKLQLIIVCPTLLEKIRDYCASTVALSKIILPDRILALLLGVTDSDIDDTHKTALNSYSQWPRMEVGQDQDENFAKEFLAKAMAIFTKVWKHQSVVTSQDKSQFSISPKKVRQGQNSVLILLTYPIQKEDIIKISIGRSNLQPLQEITAIKKRNPYTLKISIPESLLEVSAIVSVVIEKNGSIIGSRPIKCESRLRELEQILRSTSDPVEFLCQTLGLSTHEKEQKLDNWMVHMFQKNIPPNFSLFIGHGTSNSDLSQGCEEFPTLLHFAAKFGLEKLCMQLVDCPGGELACEIRNINDLTPADIAESCGYTNTANILRGYMKMNEFTTIYTKFKAMSILEEDSTETTTDALQKNSSSIEDDDGYLVPKQVDEFYKLCPAPKPVMLTLPSPSVSEPPNLYLSMQQNTKLFQQSSSIPNTSPLNASSEHHQKFQSEPSVRSASQNNLNAIPSTSKEHPLKTTPISIVPSTSTADGIVEDKSQRELLEIINDFKNNVHSIGQAEKLVEEWKNRNDVQKSFKEKQDQLNEMRARYETIQNEMKNSMKKSSSFERVKRLIFGGKSKDKMAAVVTDVQLRPISSLSIQSTSSSASGSSSGHISTNSVSSLGDSGTHSDHEALGINLFTNGNPEDDFRNLITFNYSIPPIPKPFKPVNCFPPIDERTATQNPAEKVTAEHYIQFPPSGLPVTPKSMEYRMEFNQAQQYINISVQNNPKPSTSSASDLQEYMNFPAK